MKKIIFVLVTILFFSSFLAFGTERGNIKTIKINLYPQQGYWIYSEIRDIDNKVIGYIDCNATTGGKEMSIWVIDGNYNHTINHYVSGGWLIVEVEGAASYYISNEPNDVYQGYFFWHASPSPLWSRENLDSYGIFTFEAFFDLTTTDQLEIRF